MKISFQDIKGTGPLFKDFLNQAASVKSLFSVDFRDPDAMRAHLQVQTARTRDRALLASILGRQNEKFRNRDDSVEQNIKKLLQANTLAVVTGQQAGLFGGPLYTVYKALGTITWCERLHRQFPEFEFVPVFWMEIEDHDFNEVRSVHLIGSDNELHKITYNGNDPENGNKTPINAIAVTEDIQRVVEELRNTLTKTEFTESVLAVIQDAYSAGESLAAGFAGNLAQWLGRYGLVLMDPSDAEFKRMAAPVFQKELENHEEIHRRLLEQSGVLRKMGYPVQVETEPTNLFVRDTGAGKLLFNTRSLDKVRITPEEIKNHRDVLNGMIAKEPERFIPNVVLRPLVQDFLLPTAAYLGGPGEIAYLAQFKTIYEFFGIPQPAVIPRPFVTLLEKKIKKVCDKYGLSLADIFNNGSVLVEQIAKRTSGSSESMFDELLKKLQTEIAAVESAIVKTDASLKGAAATALDKMVHAVGVLKTKTLDAEKRSNELAHSQLTKAIDSTFPYDNFQERSLSMLYFLNKYGDALLETLKKGIDEGDWDHQVIEL